MNVKINLIDDQFIHVSVKGDLSVFDEQFELFYEELIAYSRSGLYMFFFDFSAVNYIDSSGVSLLIRLAKPALDQKTMICIHIENMQVRRMFSVSNLDQLVHFVSSQEEALEFYKITLGFIPTAQS